MRLAVGADNAPKLRLWNDTATAMTGTYLAGETRGSVARHSVTLQRHWLSDSDSIG